MRSQTWSLAQQFRLFWFFRYFDHNFLKIAEINFLQNPLIHRGPKHLPLCQKLETLGHGVSRNLGPNMAESEIFKSPYLPQMGADSPHSKNVFIRAPRAIMITSQIGGQAPPRGQTWKVGVAPKFLNPHFSKNRRTIFPKFFVWIEHMNVYHRANFGENLFREKMLRQNFRKFGWGALTPKLYRIFGND